MRLFVRAFGLIVLLIGLLACVISVMAILDPVGTGHANDAAPFVPATGHASWTMLFSSIGISLFGLWIFVSGKK
jgi:hypothetical protein